MNAQDKNTKMILDLPRPTTPAKKGWGKLVFSVLVILVLGFAGGFWFTLPPEVQKSIVATTESSIEKAIESASIAPFVESFQQNIVPNVSSFFNNIVSKIPVIKDIVPSLGTKNTDRALSTVVVPGASGTSLAPAVFGAVPDGAGENEQVTVDGLPAMGSLVAKVKEDSVVKPIFVEDLAEWMVARYRPGKGGGNSNVSVQSANMRYGSGMRGLATSEDIINARAMLLRYAFNPAMLEALYNLYIEHFMESLAHIAIEPKSGQALTSAQIDDMYQIYSAKFAAASGTMRGIASLNDLPKYLKDIDNFSNKLTEVHQVLSEAVFALDEAREANDEGRMKTAQLRVDGANARYRKAMEDRAIAQNTLIAAIKKESLGRSLDDDSIIFLVSWLERRAEQQDSAKATLAKASQLLQNLSQRLAKASSIAR